MSTGKAAPGPHLARTLAAAAGLPAIAGAAFLYWPGLPFPGVAALVPALGAGAFILAGEDGGGGGGGGGGAADAPHPTPWPLPLPTRGSNTLATSRTRSTWCTGRWWCCTHS